MGYVAPTTRSTGFLVTAAVWNQDVVSNPTFLANPPACRVFHNANQSITNNTETSLAFNSERFDTDNMHDTVTNNSRITFNTAGIYVVSAAVQFAADAGGDYTTSYVVLRRGGSSPIALQTQGTFTTTAFGPHFAISTIFKFAAADYVEVRAFQVNTSAGANNVLTGGEHSCDFGAVWVGLG